MQVLVEFNEAQLTKLLHRRRGYVPAARLLMPRADDRAEKTYYILTVTVEGKEDLIFHMPANPLRMFGPDHADMIRRAEATIEGRSICDRGTVAQLQQSLLSENCSACNVANLKLLRCAKCATAKYCSKVCQVKDWPAHRQMCRVISSNRPV